MVVDMVLVVFHASWTEVGVRRSLQWFECLVRVVTLT